MPHPIPANPASIEGWRYYLVAIPDDDVAVSAAWAIYSELMNNWAWGLEGPEENSPVMAQVWADALFETIRIRTMGFPDLVLTYIDQIETYLQQLIANQIQDDYQVILDQICCDNGVVAPVEDTTGEDVVVGTGDPPGGIADWPTYQTLLCSSAEKFVDSLPGWVTILEGLSLLTNVGLAAAIAGLAGGLVAAGIAATAVLGVVSALEFLEDLRDLFDLGPSWDDARTVLNTQSVKDDLVCAIVLSTTAEAAEAAIDSVLSGTDAYDPIRLLPLRFMMNKIFNAEADAGGYGSGCTCEESLYIGGLSGQGFYVWNGSEYILRQFPPGAGALEIGAGTTLRVKGTAGNGDTQARTSDQADGSTALERTVTVSINGANGSSVTYQFWDADDTLISSGTANDNSGTFPLTVPNTWRWRLVQGGLKIDGFPTYWLDLEIE